MADTSLQHRIEGWIRDIWLPKIFDKLYLPRKVKLITSGYFEFDAVSADGKIVANISTSSSMTTGGKLGTAKIQKLRADMLFLMMVLAEKRYIVLSERDMYDLCQREKTHGRVPFEIEYLHADIPDEFKKLLKDAKKRASEEVTPGKKGIE